MKVIQINAVCGKGSTGRICTSISDKLTENDIENYIIYSSVDSDRPNAISCARRYEVKIQALKSRLLGNYGFNSVRQTKRIIKVMDRIKPDVVHLHNIHGHDCHLGMLFDYLSEKRTKVLWTFHDCWAFTGYCPHFAMAKCDQWKQGCKKCPQKSSHSVFFDRSEQLFNRKKELFTGVDLTVITPSRWLAEQVRSSFLRDCSIRVINNGINLQVFRPVDSNFRQRYGISEKKNILLGVAFEWGVRKGLDVFVEMACRLPQDKYQIVLVGTNDKIDRDLPDGIISIHRTHNQSELAEIYSAADLFINPTREDTFPTVNMESLACGTPVLTFKTGGSPEIIDDTCGSAVPDGDIDAFIQEIERICSHPYSKDACIARAAGFDADDKIDEYVALYKELE